MKIVRFNSRTFSILYRIPWLEWPLIYDIRARPFKITSPTGTSDLQMVDIGLRVLYRPDPGAIQSIAKNIGEGKTAPLIRLFPIRQIGAFRSLKIDCTKLRHRRMSWVSDICKITRTLTFQKKNQRPEFHKFHEFLTLRADCTRLRY